MRASLAETATRTGHRNILDPLFQNTAAVGCPNASPRDVHVDLRQQSSSPANVSYLELSFEDSLQGVLGMKLYEVYVY